MKLNPQRPIEELTGNNRGIVRQKLGRIHCMTSVREAVRECRIPNRRNLPVELRRGLVKCIMDTLAEYRGTFVGVMACTSLEPRPITWKE
jgi:hypothetical protein